MDDFAYWYAYFLSEEKRAWEDGWRVGYEAGRREFLDAREQDWAALYISNPWWLDALQLPGRQEMEERRYGPLPQDFTEPDHEEHPGEARRRARAANR